MIGKYVSFTPPRPEGIMHHISTAYRGYNFHSYLNYKMTCSVQRDRRFIISRLARYQTRRDGKVSEPETSIRHHVGACSHTGIATHHLPQLAFRVQLGPELTWTECFFAKTPVFYISVSYLISIPSPRRFNC